MGLKLYTNKQSRGVVAEWLLMELGVEYERIEVAFTTEMKTPEYLAINPFGKVPTLIDGEIVIYEMAAICAYLADKFIEKGFAPALDDPKRGLYYRALFMMVGCWEVAVIEHDFLKIDIKPEQTMYVDYGNYETAYHALILSLTEAQPYICGAQFTAADLYVSAYLMFQLKMGQIQAHPAIDAYLQPIREREMYQKIYMSS